MSYEVKSGKPFNKHVLWSNGLFLIVSVVCLLVMWNLEARYELLDPSGALMRFILGKSVATICGLFIILGVAQYADTKTKGALMRGIVHSPVACAIYMSSLVLIGGLIFINYQ
jgi:hypothetical protein